MQHGLYAVPFWSAAAGSTGRFSGGLLLCRSQVRPRQKIEPGGLQIRRRLDADREGTGLEDRLESGQDGVHPPRRQISLDVSEKQPRPKPVNGLLRGPFTAPARHCPAPVPHCAARVRHSCRTSPVSHANIIQRRRPMSRKAVPQDLARRSDPRRAFGGDIAEEEIAKGKLPTTPARTPSEARRQTETDLVHRRRVVIGALAPGRLEGQIERAAAGPGPRAPGASRGCSRARCPTGRRQPPASR